MRTSALVCCTILLFHGILALSNSSDEPRSTFVSNDENDDGRIVGGILTTIEKHPYQVSLWYRGRFACGGSIISNSWIITAAHCVMRNGEQFYKIKAGSTMLKRVEKDEDDEEEEEKEEEKEVAMEVEKIIIHKKYSSVRADYDIALMKLKKPLEYSVKIQPIKLAPRYNYFGPEEGKATVTGWGRIAEDGAISNQLREVTVPIVSNSECKEIYGSKKISARMLCAGILRYGGKDACQGDSGGPLVSDENLIGIVSWGFGCADKYPGVYTRVTVFRSWISDHTDI